MKQCSCDRGNKGLEDLMMKEAATEAPHKINIALNWLEKLKQVPVK